jgi:hypothetical protein
MKLQQILAEANTLQQTGHPTNQFFGTTDGLRVGIFGKMENKTFEKGLFQWVETHKEVTPCEQGEYPVSSYWGREAYWGLLTPKGLLIVQAWLKAENEGLLKKEYSSPFTYINSPSIEKMDLTNPIYLK